LYRMCIPLPVKKKHIRYLEEQRCMQRGIKLIPIKSMFPNAPTPSSSRKKRKLHIRLLGHRSGTYGFDAWNAREPRASWWGRRGSGATPSRKAGMAHSLCANGGNRGEGVREEVAISFAFSTGWSLLHCTLLTYCPSL
jgi:hypothetical protein